MFGFIIAAAAGFLTPQLEGAAARPVAKMLQDYIPLEETEIRLLAFMIAMLIAGVCAVLLGSGSAFWVVFGGVLGYFGTRIVDAVKKVIAARNEG